MKHLRCVPYSSWPYPRSLVLPCVAAAIILLGGCGLLEYKPSAEVFVEVPLPETGITLDLRANGDTLLGYGVLRIRYKLDLQGKRFSHTNLYVGTTHVAQSESATQLEIDTRTLPQGLQPFTLEALAHSGTRSMADRLDAEFVFDRITGYLWIDNGPPGAVSIRSMEPRDGRLGISWEQYGRPNFDSYRIVRSMTGFSDPSPWGSQVVAVINNRSTTSWLDPDFVGGRVWYRVEVVAGQNAAASAISEYFDEGPRIASIDVLPDRSARITWGQSRYPKNFRSYGLTIRDGHEAGSVWLEGVADTVHVTQPLLFGALHSATLSTQSANSDWTDEAAPLPAYERADITSLPQVLESGLVALAGSSIVLLDRENGSVRVSVPVSENARIAASPGGKRLYMLQGNVLSELDIRTLQTVSSTNLNQILGYSLVADHLSVTDGDAISVFVYQLVGGVEHGRGVHAIDLRARRVLFRPARWNDGMSLSPSGEYVIRVDETGETLYRVVDGALEAHHVDATPCSNRRYVFFSYESLGRACNGAMLIRQLNDLQEVRTYQIPHDIAGLSFDQENGLLGIWHDGERSFTVVDAASGAHQRTVQVYNRGGPYALIDGAIWSRRGSFLDIR